MYFAVGKLSALLIGIYATFGYKNIIGLSNRLSADARIHDKTSPAFVILTANWNPALRPQIDVAVEAATVSDIQETIAFARAHQRPLVIRTTGHGKSRKLLEVQNGIQLSLRKFNEIIFNANENTVTIGAGVINHELVSYLWRHGKRTATLGCDCVSIVGAALGGGHGREQGIYGLVSDQIVSMKLVTADGTILETSQEKNPELFWAMKGAGHNFGVVFETTLSVYDIPSGWGDNHFIGNYYFRSEQLEQIINALTQTLQSLDPELTIFAEFRVRYIRVNIQYGGSKQIPDVIPSIIALGPMATSNMTVPWVDVPAASGYGLSSPVCQIRPDTYHSERSIVVDQLQSDAIREVMLLLSEMEKGLPGVLLDSFLFIELYGFPTQLSGGGVYAHRGLSTVIATLQTHYAEANMEGPATALAEGAKRLLLKHQTRQKVYVNYANGDEGELAWYGEESRVQRLRQLKKVYDPDGVFSLFGTIDSLPGGNDEL